MLGQQQAEPSQPIIEHLIELRGRVLRALLAIGILLVPLLFFANDLFAYLAGPLLRHLPEGSTLIATQVASPFFTPFKLALMTAIVLAVPFWLYQIWAFIAPGLYDNEKKLVWPLLLSSTLLFYFGIAFAYFAVFPLVFGFFVNTAPDGVAVMTDIGSYLDFVLALFFAFGISFEVPVAIVLLVKSGVLTVESLQEKRPYVLLVAFVIGMFLTPPDVISQTLLAIPMYILYEVGIVMGRFVQRKAEAKAAAAADEA